MSISGDPSANLVKISAVSQSPKTSADLANEVALALVNYSAAGQKSLLRAQVAALERQLRAFAGQTTPSDVAAASDLRTQLSQTEAQLAVSRSDLSVLTPAAVPSSPSAPHPKRNGGIGLLAGFILGVIIATLRDVLTAVFAGSTRSRRSTTLR